MENIEHVLYMSMNINMHKEVGLMINYLFSFQFLLFHCEETFIKLLLTPDLDNGCRLTGTPVKKYTPHITLHTSHYRHITLSTHHTPHITLSTHHSLHTSHMYMHI